MTVALLFGETPQQWGLRGDVHLWREMRERFESVPLPPDPSALDGLLAEAFESLTGCSIESDGYCFVKRLDHGGMSGGCVSPPWWRGTALPLLRSRHRAV